MMRLGIFIALMVLAVLGVLYYRFWFRPEVAESPQPQESRLAVTAFDQ